MASSSSAVSSSAAYSVIATAVATLSLATLTVILRFITRGTILRFIGNEDWSIAAALLFSIGNTAGMVLQAKYALGQHLQDLSADNIVLFLKAAFYTIISYNISLTLTKISVLLLFLRLFQTDGRRAVHVAITIVGIYGLWALCSSIFFCYPIPAFWDSTVPNATCLPKEPVWFANAALNILTDLMIFILPIPVLVRLNLGRRKKIGLICVFAIGFFVCIISVVRLHSLYVASTSDDPTWDNVGVALWSTLELNIAIICACLTTLKPLIARFFPHLFSTSHNTNAEYVCHISEFDVTSRLARLSKVKTAQGVDSESQRGIVVGSKNSLELSHIVVR